MLTEIDHVAIAVHDLEAAIEYYRVTYGVEPVHRERIEKDGVDEALIKVADSYIQLLTPTRDDSPVAKFLAAKGEGMHHVGYRVDSCAEALDRVKGEGHRVIDEAPRPIPKSPICLNSAPSGRFPGRGRRRRRNRYSWTSSISVPNAALGWTKATVVPRLPGRGT